MGTNAPSIAIGQANYKMPTSNECDYACTKCKFGCDAVVMRKDLPDHEALCPFRILNCKWCQLKLFANCLLEHESICEEREVECTHARLGCTAVIPFDMRAQHVANDCLYEVVDCPFSSVGCNGRMMRKDIDSHEEAAMKQHNRLLSLNIQSLQQKAVEQEGSIQSLNRDKQTLQQKIASQDTTADNQGKKSIEQAKSIQSLERDISLLRQQMVSLKLTNGSNCITQEAPLHEIVFKVKVADLVRGGAVRNRSDYRMVGAYNLNVSVQKGSVADGDFLGVFLHVENGPFPCHAKFTLEVVHWDRKVESARKGVFTNTFEKEGGYGWPDCIRLSKIAAAESPYVSNEKGIPGFFCPQHHPLALTIRSGRAICDVCERPTGMVHNLCCRSCDYDICDECSNVTNHTKGTNGLYYCGRRLGVTAIPGSDGQCGPNDGPQCKGCQALFPGMVTFIANFRIVGK